jgi:uroporphyrinogen III methyltransferase/synthase
LGQRLDQFDGKLNTLQTTQQTLQQHYQDATRDQDAWTLAEVGQLLTTANDQLHLTGNVQLALLALRNADTRLAASSTPQVLAARQAVQGDIAKLQAAPQTDLTGLTVKLDILLDQIDSLPLLGEADAKPGTVSAASATAATPTSTTAPANGSLPAWRRWLTEFGNDLLGHLRGLVQIRSLDNADGMLLAPQQDAYLRENLKLRLLSARLSLLTRNQAIFKADISAVSTALARYFDPDAAQVQNMQSVLRQLKQATLAPPLPDLSDSLAAVRQLRNTGNRSQA